ncbi:glycosyltransferase family 4 protein, partial [Enterococcus cecorum]|nr:glycosyltransferase family 4 protein [Enterococcus cecorum]
VKDNYAIFVGNYLSGKNQAMILNAFYKSNTDLNFGLTLIGSCKTPYYDELVSLKEKLEKNYGRRKVDILYGLSREDTINYVKRAKLYLMGSKGEKFPISIIEAMASGIPFISTNVGIVRYLPGGQIVSSEQEMIYWISLLASNDKIATHLGEIGKSYAIEHFTTQHSIDELERLLL